MYSKRKNPLGPYKNTHLLQTHWNIFVRAQQDNLEVTKHFINNNFHSNGRDHVN